jgi:hypothetical protein
MQRVYQLHPQFTGTHNAQRTGTSTFTRDHNPPCAKGGMECSFGIAQNSNDIFPTFCLKFLGIFRTMLNFPPQLLSSNRPNEHLITRIRLSRPNSPKLPRIRGIFRHSGLA